jgi:hypothetical protein
MSKGMMAAILGDEIDRDAYVNREVLLSAVRHEMVCQSSGVLLDIGSAVMSTVTMPDSRTISIITTGEAFDAQGGREHIKAVADRYGATFEIIDGRDYTAAGKLSKKARERIEAERATTVA